MLLRWVCSFLRVKTQVLSLDFWYLMSMASRISLSFLVRTMVGGLMVSLALQDCLEELALEELDLLELLRGRSFSFLAFVLKKLNVLSIVRERLLYNAGLLRDEHGICAGKCDQNYQKSLMMVTLMESNIAPSVWFSHSISTFLRSSSLFMSTLSALKPLRSLCLLNSSLNSSKECDPRQTRPWRRWWRSFSWQTPRKPQSMGLRTRGRAWRASVRCFSSSWKVKSLSGAQCSSTSVQRRLSYMSQKQGKQEILDSWPLRVLLKKLQSSSLRFSLEGQAIWGDSTSFTISRGMASSIFFCSGSSSSSNSTGRHSLTQKEAFPQTSSNSGLLAIFSHLLKRTHLLFLNFSSKTNLQATNISQAMMILRKEQSVLKRSPLSAISWSSFRISFLMRPRRASYLLFLTFSWPNRQRQNSSRRGKRERLSSNRRSFILAHRRISLPQRLIMRFQLPSSASELSVRLFSLRVSRQQLRKLSLTMQPMISYSSLSSPWGVRSRNGLASASVTSSRKQFNLENLISVTILRAFIQAIWQWKDTSCFAPNARYSRLPYPSFSGFSLILILIQY